MGGTRRDGLVGLERARQALGLSVEEASARTRIPARYLEALERGDLTAFPPGPFLSGYTRQYRAFLHLPDAPAPDLRAEPEYTVTEPARPGRKSRLQAARFAIIGALGLTALVLAVALSHELWREPETEPGVPPDQKVSIRAAEAQHIRVVADGRQLAETTLPALTTVPFAAHDRLEIELETLDQVQLSYNGQALKPLGATSRPRRLIFIDDHPSH